jgi:hypothetical protein
MNRSTKLVVAGLLAAATLAPVATLAFANEPYLPRREMTFKRLDTNGDGKITISEFAPLVDKRFALLDTNGDKAVTAAEIEKRMQDAITRRKDRIMKFLDRDADGKITENELDNLVQAMFNSADTDRDGGVSLAEAQAFKRSEWRKQVMSGSAN